MNVDPMEVARENFVEELVLFEEIEEERIDSYWET